jgi:ZipA-like protein with FtsZ-binding domain
MDDLRWALLGLGGLFIAGLAWWEMRKPRHAGRDSDLEPASEAPTRRREPRIGDVEPPVAEDSSYPTLRAIDPREDPPVLLIDDVPDIGAAMDLSIAPDVAVDSPGSGEAIVAPPDVLAEEAAPFDVPTEAAVKPPPAPTAQRTGPPEPNWPPEDQRRIVSLRVVPRPPARFNGRSLRLAFESAGLEFGAFDIYHLVDESGEVVASAANLMRPGTFDPAGMDGSYFHGVHLFCVLPGPLPAGRAVDELVALSRDLAQRISGMVLDAVGQPLDEERVAAVRGEAVAAESVR